MKKFNTQIVIAGALFVFSIIATGYVLHDKDVPHDANFNLTEHQMNDAGKTTIVTRNGKTVTVEPGEVLEIRSEGADLSYDITEIRAQAGSELTIKYLNTSTMPHNIVFVNSEGDINPVGVAALQAYENDYIPENEMEKIFGNTSLAVPGDTVEVTITVPEETGSYPYICTYPGHFTQMQGRLISRKSS